MQIQQATFDSRDYSPRERVQGCKPGSPTGVQKETCGAGM